MEIWKSVVGHEGYYEVSNTGLIKSFVKNKDGAILKTALDKRGYCQVNLLKPFKEHRNLHTLVALAFLGPRPDGLYIDHIDGNPSNNLSDNLQYVTPRSNIIKSKLCLLNNNKHSKYPGVTYHVRGHKFQAYKKFKNENFYLGSFDSEIEAYNAYLSADYETAKKYKQSLIDKQYSKIRGVGYNKSLGYWTVRTKKIKTRYFKTQQEAINFIKDAE